ncbi:MAG TPA: hypothetical protein VNA31_01040 [bacterium]|nr:hypothetical protein [bacterium]
MKAYQRALCGLIALASSGCNVLDVTNTNSPNRNAALGTPTDLENFVGFTYAVAHSGTLGGAAIPGCTEPCIDGLQAQLQTMGMENVSGLANFAMGPRSAIPRNPIDNTPGSQGNVGDYRDFIVESRAARMATLAIAKLAQFGTLGSDARTARARAFARFVQGVALGNLALAYDSAAIATENNTTTDLVPLSHYDVVMTAALGYLDSAIAIATGPVPAGPTTDWFPPPSAAPWINGVTLTAPLLAQIAHSYKARFRAGVARTPAERATVGWSQVIADAAAGVSTDLNVTMAPSQGWDVSWAQQHYATGSANWHQMSQFFMGMADSSGGYDTWLGTAPSSRVPFVVVTPDKRFPQGSSRTLQQTDTQPTSFASTRYFRNRPSGEDQPGDPLNISMYDYRRSFGFFSNSRNGPYPIMTRAEIRLLAAEGYLRTGSVPQAAAMIDSSRTAKGHLPPLTGVVLDTITAVPGGAACVPHVPDPATSLKKSKCGTIWDALKWEYRMETAYTGYGMWYFAARGWGDLPEGTAVHWPVPYQEMQVRSEVYYGLGGVGQVGGSAPGNYGLFKGGVY